MSVGGAFNSDSKTESTTFQTDQSATASDNAIINANRRSGNALIRLGKGASYEVNNTYEGLSRDDLAELLASTNPATGLSTSVSLSDPARKDLNAKAAGQSLEFFGPKAKVFWIVGALVLVALVAVGSAFWHSKKKK